MLGFPCGSAGEESACNAGDLGSIPGLGRCPGGGNSYPLQYSGLENSMDRGTAGCSSWSRKELDTTERLTHTHHTHESVLNSLCHIARNLDGVKSHH